MRGLRYLLDTDICIYVAKRRPAEVLARFRKVRPGEVAMSVVTYGELSYGARKSSRSAEALASAVGILVLDIALIFSLIYLTPGDQALMIVGGERGISVNLETVRQQLGLDKPVLAQFLSYLNGVTRGDLWRSFFSNEPVGAMLWARIPMTFTLAFISLLIGVAIAIPTGILAAIKRGSVLDQGFMFLAIFGVSMPAFWFALVLMLIFAVKFGWFPVVGYVGFFENPAAWLSHLALPAVAIGFAQSALIARMTRSSQYLYCWNESPIRA